MLETIANYVFIKSGMFRQWYKKEMDNVFSEVCYDIERIGFIDTAEEIKQKYIKKLEAVRRGKFSKK